jgi:hypothetical protein
MQSVTFYNVIIAPHLLPGFFSPEDTPPSARRARTFAARGKAGQAPLFLVLASWLLGSAKLTCLQRQKPAMFAQKPLCVYRHFTGAACTTSFNGRFASFSPASGLSNSSDMFAPRDNLEAVA